MKKAIKLNKYTNENFHIVGEPFDTKGRFSKYDLYVGDIVRMNNGRIGVVLTDFIITKKEIGTESHVVELITSYKNIKVGDTFFNQLVEFVHLNGGEY